MAAFLQKPLVSAALCWRLERRDGITLGFTSHDRDLEVSGLVYRAAPGMLPSSISLKDGFEPDNLDIKGALTSDLIRGEDLRAGRWDDAAVSIFMADWEVPDQVMAIARGALGDVSIRGEAFEVELKGPTTELDRPVVEQTSPECRANLGDKRCRIDMAARTRITRVTSLIGEDVVEVASAAGGGAYAYGRLRWMSGANSGLSGAILASVGAELTLREPPPFAPVEGDLVEIVEGCDKRLETCAGRFANAANFRGEPHLPGVDLLTRYPGA